MIMCLQCNSRNTAVQDNSFVAENNVGRRSVFGSVQSMGRTNSSFKMVIYCNDCGSIVNLDAKVDRWTIERSEPGRLDAQRRMMKTSSKRIEKEPVGPATPPDLFDFGD